MVHLGFDDTDSRRGLCTTWLATEFVREFRDWDLLGYPRLVRLNPNVPWKTRGNGAICLRLGRGRGPRFIVGQIEGRQV
ncbi:MAG: DNA-binding protein, partial [Candidatus Thermoplasmatota archaeon]